MPARRFPLPAPRPWSIVGRALAITAALALAAAALLTALVPIHGFWTYFAVASLVFGGPLLFLVPEIVRDLWTPPPRVVTVGADGVLVGDRFISYADVHRVIHERRSRPVYRSTQGGGEVEEILYEWAVHLELNEERKGGILLAGENVEMVTRRSLAELGDPLGQDLSRTIEDALAAWTEGRRDRDVEVRVARGGRAAADWLDALRRLGAGAMDSYRKAAADVEKLSRLLDDPHEEPSARAAAAVVLAASGDATAAHRLRVAARAVVDPRVRVALEHVADETAVAEALEALDEADRAREAGRRRAARAAARG